MDLSKAIKIRINDLINENNMTIYQLCKRAGISRSVLSKFLNSEIRYLRIDMIEYIREALQIKLKDFLTMRYLKILI